MRNRCLLVQQTSARSRAEPRSANPCRALPSRHAFLARWYCSSACVSSALCPSVNRESKQTCVFASRASTVFQCPGPYSRSQHVSASCRVRNAAPRSPRRSCILPSESSEPAISLWMAPRTWRSIASIFSASAMASFSFPARSSRLASREWQSCCSSMPSGQRGRGRRPRHGDVEQQDQQAQTGCRIPAGHGAFLHDRKRGAAPTSNRMNLNHLIR